MRAHQYLSLDLQHQEFLTDDKGKMLTDQDGQPYRVAHCTASNKRFVRVAEHQDIHATGDHPRFGKLTESEISKRRERIATLKPIHVSGHGHWIPLEELPGFEHTATPTPGHEVKPGPGGIILIKA